jgi:hypothetical protein
MIQELLLIYLMEVELDSCGVKLRQEAYSHKLKFIM